MLKQYQETIEQDEFKDFYTDIQNFVQILIYFGSPGILCLLLIIEETYHFI